MDQNKVDRAIRVTNGDVVNRNFLQFPFEKEIFDANTASISESIIEQLETGSYRPSDCLWADVPKGNGAIRPGALVSIKDQLAFSLIIERVFSNIHSDLSQSQNVLDFGYQLYPSDSSQKWFHDWFYCWDSWKADSLRKIEDDYQFVVFTDISGCYENIDYKILMSDLNRIGVDNSTQSTIRNMLIKWSSMDTKGLPQAISASHLLAKLYLSSIDLKLNNLGYTHTRYVDDIRIFCNTRAEAKKALVDLAISLRKRGLNLQSSKTFILDAEKARAEIIGRANTIEILAAKMMIEIENETLRQDPYMASISINSTILNNAQLEIVKQAFNDNFIQSSTTQFDKTLFHYLINKLGTSHDDYAVDYSLDTIERKPQETKFILPYLSSIQDKNRIKNQLIAILTSPNSVYDYQNYLIAKWLFDNETSTEAFLTYLREIARDSNKPSYFSALAKQCLGQYGTHADIESIKESYVHTTSDVERDAIICAISKMEVSARNGYYRQLAHDESRAEMACAFARTLS